MNIPNVFLSYENKTIYEKNIELPFNLETISHY